MPASLKQTSEWVYTVDGNQTAFGLARIERTHTPLAAAFTFRLDRTITNGAEVSIDLTAGPLTNLGSRPHVLILPRNVTGTNFIKIGTATGVYGSEIGPSGKFETQLATGVTSLFLRADSANAIVDIYLSAA